MNAFEAASMVGRAAGLDGLPAMETVPRLAAMGCRSLELILGSPGHFDHTDAAAVNALVRLAEDCGVSFPSVHLPFGEALDLSNPDLAARGRVEDVQRAGLDVAASLGAKVAIVHPGYFEGHEGRQERLDIAADAVARLAEYAAAAGVRLAVENMLGSFLGNHEDELAMVVSRCDPAWCGYCFDSGHAHLLGRAAELAAAMLPRAFTTHLHDNTGLDDRHLFPGMGTIDWSAVGSAYRSSGMRASLLVESSNVLDRRWSDSAWRVVRLLGLDR
jgi:sugar phosphate isomerase/epimerase